MRRDRYDGGPKRGPMIQPARLAPAAIGRSAALWLFCVIGLWGLPAPTRTALAQTVIEPAAENDTDRRYITREERRDEAPEHEITEWLSWAALAEAEYVDTRFDTFEQASGTRNRDAGWTVEALLLAEPLSWLAGELVFEYDSFSDDIVLDEAFVAAEIGDFELEFGRLFLPFGVYLTHFATGPLLEFGDTRGRGAILSYGADDWLGVSAFVYQGQANKRTRSGRGLDWGLALQVAASDFSTLGLSYISDLADSDEEFLDDSNNRFAARVAGLSGYLILGFGPVEFTAEFVSALGSFEELDDDRDQPRAWNTELAYYPRDAVGLALRYEHSSEFEDAPRRQGGLALLLQPLDGLFLTLEYLVGDYRRGFAPDDEDRDLDTVHRFGALITLEI